MTTTLPFDERMPILKKRFEELVTAVPFKMPIRGRRIPEKGVYLFSDGEASYVGRSDDLRSRLSFHVRPSSSETMAAFAALLAKKKLSIGPDYSVRRKSPEHHSSREDFRQAFKEAKDRIRLMDIRVVEEPDAENQALLEIFVHLALGTCNNFRNH
jgi:hypothetical protein